MSETFGYRALNVRPGLIVGPHDPTDRFALLGRALRAPALLGERAPDGGRVPHPPSRPVQMHRRARSRRLHARAPRQGPRRDAQRDAAPRGSGRWAASIDALRRRGGAAARRRAWVDEQIAARAKVDAVDRASAVDSRIRSRTRRASCRSTARKRSAPGLRTRPLADDDRGHRGVARAARQRRATWKDVLDRRCRARDPRAAPCMKPSACGRMTRTIPPAISSSRYAPRKRAGEAILPHFRAAIAVEDKRNFMGYDPVTVADHAAEAGHPRRDQGARIPTHGIHGEEHGREARHVADDVGDRPDRRHQELHPRPAALGHAHRAARRHARRWSASRTSRSSARRSSAPRATRRNGGGATSGARCAPVHVRSIEDAVVADHRPAPVRDRGGAAPRSRAVVGPGAASCATAAIATATPNSRWDSSTSSSRTACSRTTSRR